jgi:hypothetical protein
MLLIERTTAIAAIWLSVSWSSDATSWSSASVSGRPRSSSTPDLGQLVCDRARHVLEASVLGDLDPCVLLPVCIGVLRDIGRRITHGDVDETVLSTD